MSTVPIPLLLDHAPVIGTLPGIAPVSRAILRGSTEVAKTALGLSVILDQ
jgi:hypothetical protein